MHSGVHARMHACMLWPWPHLLVYAWDACVVCARSHNAAARVRRLELHVAANVVVVMVRVDNAVQLPAAAWQATRGRPRGRQPPARTPCAPPSPIALPRHHHAVIIKPAATRSCFLSQAAQVVLHGRIILVNACNCIRLAIPSRPCWHAGNASHNPPKRRTGDAHAGSLASWHGLRAHRACSAACTGPASAGSTTAVLPLGPS